MRLVDDLVGLHARFFDDLRRRVLRIVERLGALVGRSQTVGDLLLSLFDRLDQRRPNELHGEPSEDEEHQRLDDQR
jgi:hypothetical protein